MTICEEANEIVGTDRQQTYGHPKDDYERVAGMFNALFADKIDDPFDAGEMVMVMLLVKLSRESYLPKRDNRVDLAGYAQCLDLIRQAEDAAEIRKALDEFKWEASLEGGRSSDAECEL